MLPKACMYATKWKIQPEGRPIVPTCTRAEKLHDIQRILSSLHFPSWTWALQHLHLKDRTI